MNPVQCFSLGSSIQDLVPRSTDQSELWLAKFEKLALLPQYDVNDGTLQFIERAAVSDRAQRIGISTTEIQKVASKCLKKLRSLPDAVNRNERIFKLLTFSGQTNNAIKHIRNLDKNDRVSCLQNLTINSRLLELLGSSSSNKLIDFVEKDLPTLAKIACLLFEFNGSKQAVEYINKTRFEIIRLESFEKIYTDMPFEFSISNLRIQHFYDKELPPLKSRKKLFVQFLKSWLVAALVRDPMPDSTDMNPFFCYGKFGLTTEDFLRLFNDGKCVQEIDGFEIFFSKPEKLDFFSKLINHVKTEISFSDAFIAELTKLPKKEMNVDTYIQIFEKLFRASYLKLFSSERPHQLINGGNFSYYFQDLLKQVGLEELLPHLQKATAEYLLSLFLINHLRDPSSRKIEQRDYQTPFEDFLSYSKESQIKNVHFYHVLNGGKFSEYFQRSLGQAEIGQCLPFLQRLATEQLPILICDSLIGDLTKYSKMKLQERELELVLVGKLLQYLMWSQLDLTRTRKFLNGGELSVYFQGLIKHAKLERYLPCFQRAAKEIEIHVEETAALESRAAHSAP